MFPETGSITYSPRWLDLKRDAGCNMNNTLIATSFRRFLNERGIAREAANILRKGGEGLNAHLDP